MINDVKCAVMLARRCEDLGLEYELTVRPKYVGDEFRTLQPHHDFIIFNGNKTILKTKYSNFITTCDNEDNFDKEKGVMLCLLKSCGYSYTDVKKLVDNAKDTSNKVTKKQKKELKNLNKTMANLLVLAKVDDLFTK